jgi:hypothetical protein
MYEIVRSKAETNGTYFRNHLLRTQDDLLIETNNWHDQHWGSCDCSQHRRWPGQNHLGRTLMRVRAELRGDPADRWTRVMGTGHRDKYLSDDQRAWMGEQLDRVAAKLIAEHGMRIAIHGGATGADLAWARAADAVGVDALWAYLPFPQQTTGWSLSQMEQWRTYTDPRVSGGRSDRTEFLADNFSVAALHARNDWMIRDADAVIAVADPDKRTATP